MSRPQIYEQMDQMATRIEERLENLSAIYKKPNLGAAVAIMVTTDSCLTALLQMARALGDDSERSTRILDQAADVATSCISSAMENILEVLRPIEDEQTFVKDVMGILKMRHDLQLQILRSTE